MQTAKKNIRRVAIAVVGGLVLLFGIIAIPYPGPGWLIVFTGLAILATEFAWAQRVLQFARSKYDAWTAWLKAQKSPVRVLVIAATSLVVLLTLWLLNVFGMVSGWLGLPFSWLQSPFVN